MYFLKHCFKIVKNYKNISIVKIISILKNLLLLQSRVEIPNLGAFIAKEKSAKLDDKSGEILPPNKDLSFDSSSPKNDDLLKNTLQANGFSEEDATKQIKEFVEAIKSSLNENKTFEVGDLGYFKADDDKILFVQNENSPSLVIDAVGMKKITVTPGDPKQISQTKDKPEKKVKKEKPTKVAKPPKEKKTVDKTKRKKVVKSILFAVPVIIVIVLLSLFHKPIIEKAKNIFTKNTDTTQNIVDNNTTDTLTFTDNTNNAPDTTSSNNSNSTDYTDDFGNDVDYRKILDADIPNTAEVYLGNNYKKFYLIVNSYKQDSYAQNYAQQLRNQGYNPDVLSGTEYFRVTIGGYNTADNLISDYNHYYDKFNGKIWILINKQ